MSIPQASSVDFVLNEKNAPLNKTYKQQRTSEVRYENIHVIN